VYFIQYTAILLFYKLSKTFAMPKPKNEPLHTRTSAEKFPGGEGDAMEKRPKNSKKKSEK